MRFFAKICVLAGKKDQKNNICDIIPCLSRDYAFLNIQKHNKLLE